MIKAVNASGQWTLKPYIRSPEAWTRVSPANCPTPANGACFNANQPAPFDRPLQVMGNDEIRVNFAWNNKSSINLFGASKIPTFITFRVSRKSQRLSGSCCCCGGA